MAINHGSMAAATPAATPDSRSIDEAPRQHSKEEEKAIDEMPQHVTHPSANDEDEYPNSLKLVSVIVALVLAVFLASLDMNIIATAIPRITDEFHSLDQVLRDYPPSKIELVC